MRRVELLVGWWEKGWRLDILVLTSVIGSVSCTSTGLTFADSLLCAHLGAVFHGMQGEIDLRYRFLLRYSASCNVKVVDSLHSLDSGATTQKTTRLNKTLLVEDWLSAATAAETEKWQEAGGIWPETIRRRSILSWSYSFCCGSDNTHQCITCPG